MNALSWVLYAADVLPTLSTIMGSFAIVGLVLSSALGAASTIERIAEGKPSQTGQLVGNFALRKLFPACFLLLLAANIIPSRTTILMIAASESGERMAQSADGQQIVKELREVIRIQLDKLKK